MATSSTTPIASLLLKNKNTHNQTSLSYDVHLSFLHRSDFQRFSVTSPSKEVSRDLIVRRVTPEVAGDLISSFPLPPWLPSDNPWLMGAAGLFVGGPFLIQRLVAFTKTLDMAAQTVENIADAVEKVAEKVEKAAEEFEEALPEGRLKEAVHFVEHLAEETKEEADKISDLMDKVEEIDDRLEEFLDKNLKGSGKA